MDLKSYLCRREELKRNEKPTREICKSCRQPAFACYCQLITKLNPIIKFIILIHPIESKRRIATGRMTHLILQNSELIEGQDFSTNERVNQIIDDPNYQSFVLYPGINSTNISLCNNKAKALGIDIKKELVVFVIDGTWATARKMMSQSKNLKNIPRFCFTPVTESQFRVRKQPKVDCYSTIEAVHYCIEILGSTKGFNTSTRVHDHLINAFNQMVEKQLNYVRDAYDNPKSTSYRKPRIRVA